MNTRSLREDLLAISGVEGAEVDGDASSPSGLRVRVSQHADQKRVGESIRRVLSDHGFGTDTQLPGEPAPPPHADHSMASVSESDVDSASLSELATESKTPVSTLVSVPPDEDQRGHADDDDEMASVPEPETRRVIDLVAEEAASAPEPEPESEFSVQPSTGTSRRTTIERVAVAEGRGGIVVTVVASDGESETEMAHATEGGVEQAVVLATARLAAPGGPAPVVIDIDDRRIEGTDIVMIVLDNNGEITTGSAVVGAGRAFALGRATWAAMLV